MEESVLVVKPAQNRARHRFTAQSKPSSLSDFG